MGEVQNGEFSVIYSCGVVIGAGRLDLIVEIAERFLSAVKRYKGPPFFSPLAPAYSFIPRSEPSCIGLSPVPTVLCARCKAEVGLAIVEAITIDMVNEQPVGRFHNLAVHLDDPTIHLAAKTSHGIESTLKGVNVPLMLIQPLIIFGVNCCVFALRKRDSAEGIAEAEPTI